MTTMKHNALLRQTRSVDVWWSAPLSNLAAMRTNWFSDRLKKIKPAIKTSRKVLNGPYVHNKLSYVFFPSSSSGHSSYFQWRVTGRASVTAAFLLLCKLRPDSRDRSDLCAESAVSPVNPAETSRRDKRRVWVTSSLYRLVASHRTFAVRSRMMKSPGTASSNVKNLQFECRRHRIHSVGLNY